MPNSLCVCSQIFYSLYKVKHIFWEDGVWTKFERETIEQKANDSGIHSFLAIVQLSWKLCLLYTYLLLHICINDIQLVANESMTAAAHVRKQLTGVL